MVDIVGDADVLEVCTVLFSSLAEVDVQVVQSYWRVAHSTRRLTRWTHQQLVHNDVVAVDADLGQLLNQPFRLVQAEKLCNTHADKRGCCWISKLRVDLLDCWKHLLQSSRQKVRIEAACLTTEHPSHVGDERRKLIFQPEQFSQTLFHHCREGEKS